MAGFSPEEVAAELKRRGDEIKDREREQMEQAFQHRLENADTTCAHCGIPISSVGRFADFPLCDACDGD